ncbi:MAG TPA: GatB/YqeY domain-containing protein [Candidatus Paceibacterota bacterium]|nr:GatB/YqeY domain-containing protein [Candidatus Paceibacterota bacterium]
MLTQTIREDMIAAMKAKDATRLATLRGALTAFTNELVAKGRKPTEQLEDADAIAVLKRLAKQRKDSIEQFTAGNRPELAEAERAELAIIEAYLPAMATREAIEAAIEKHMAGVTPGDKAAMGKLMGAVMSELGGNADGALVKEAVTEKLRA